MVEISTGEYVEHEVYGRVQITGFISVGDEVEINEVERNDEESLDVVLSVNGDKVEFIDENGKEYAEPLEVFYDKVFLE